MSNNKTQSEMKTVKHFNVINKETREIENSFTLISKGLTFLKRVDLWIMQSKNEDKDFEVEMWEDDKRTLVIESLFMDRMLNSER